MSQSDGPVECCDDDHRRLRTRFFFFYLIFFLSRFRFPRCGVRVYVPVRHTSTYIYMYISVQRERVSVYKNQFVLHLSAVFLFFFFFFSLSPFFSASSSSSSLVYLFSISRTHTHAHARAYEHTLFPLSRDLFPPRAPTCTLYVCVRVAVCNGVDKQLRPRIPIGFDRRLSGRDGHRVVVVAHTAARFGSGFVFRALAAHPPGLATTARSYRAYVTEITSVHHHRYYYHYHAAHKRGIECYTYVLIHTAFECVRTVSGLKEKPMVYCYASTVVMHEKGRKGRIRVQTSPNNKEKKTRSREMEKLRYRKSAGAISRTRRYEPVLTTVLLAVFKET